MLGAFATALSLAAIITGIYAFTDLNGSCIGETFESGYVCRPCRDFLNPFCNSCDSKDSCNNCDDGFYPYGRSCV
jgi:hypothetical protein